jgi:hypothetical protein
MDQQHLLKLKQKNGNIKLFVKILQFIHKIVMIRNRNKIWHTLLSTNFDWGAKYWKLNQRRLTLTLRWASLCSRSAICSLVSSRLVASCFFLCSRSFFNLHNGQVFTIGRTVTANIYRINVGKLSYPLRKANK